MIACHNQIMAEPFDIDLLRRNLRAIMGRKQVKETTLSLRVGKSPSLVSDLMKKTGDAKLSTLFKLAEALGVPATSLLDGDLELLPNGPIVYLKGQVAAGAWVEAFEWPMDEWQPMTGRADLKIEPSQRYFLSIKGDSMNLVYPEGTLIECVSVFSNVEAAPGRKVVVLRKRFDQRMEATVKELVEIEGELWLAPRSTNASHQSYKLSDPGDGIEEVSIIATVVSSVRPE